MKALVLLLVALGVITTTTTEGAAFALSSSNNSNRVSYYGSDFYEHTLGRVRDGELKKALKDILAAGHVPVQGGFDKIVEDKDCRGMKDCYTHVTYGYDRARKFLFGQYYLVDMGGKDYGVREMYCDRVYDESDFKGGPAPAPGVIPDHQVVNVEHTWPQSKFTGRFPKEMQKSDMHHLFPTDSVMNSLRGNTIFGEVSHDKGKTKCTVSRYGTGTAGSTQIYEPPDSHKGPVARALLYFSVRYDAAIRQEEEVVLKKWNREYPVDAEEADRNDAIAQIQGNRNPFIDHPEMAEQITDF